MSSEQNRFDDFLKRKLDSKEFAFDEEYWLSAKKMIADSRKNKRRRFIAFIIPSIVFVFVSAGILLTEPESKKSQQKLALQESPITSIDKQEIFLKVNTLIENSKTKNVTHILSNIKNTTIENHKTHSSKAKNNNIRKQSHISKHNTSAAVANSVAINSTNKSLAQQDRELSITLTSNEESSPINNNKISSPHLIDSKQYSPLSPSIILFDSLSKKYAYMKEHDKQLQQRLLTIEGGLNCFNPANGSLIDALQIHAGIRYFYFIHPKIALSTGITYTRLNENLSERSYKNITYGFGETVRTTSIKTLRLDYAELPLNIHYAFAKNHFINAGVSFSYLIQSAELIKTQNETVKEKHDNGHKQAINSYDAQVNFGYMAFLPKGFNIALNYHYGLMDVSKNESFKSNTFDRNSGLRLTVGYRLF